MFLVAIYILLIFLVAAFFVWLADNPGSVTVQWDWLSTSESYEITLLMAVLGIAALIVISMIIWGILSSIWNSPKIFGRWNAGRRRDKGYQALSKGLIAAGSGNVQLARKMSKESDKFLTNEPLVNVLDAQTALLEGNHQEARKQFENMLGDDQTKLLGLRGLYVEAEKENVPEAAAYFAKEANKQAPGTSWAGTALLKAQTHAGDWADALDTLKQNKSAGLYKPEEYNRKRAVILTALAMDEEVRQPDSAAEHALAAHKLVTSFSPAAVVAARIFSRLDKDRKAGKILEKTWKESPHPAIADAYIHLRSGDTAQERLKRARYLAGKNAEAIEGQFGIASAAIEAGEFESARGILAGILQIKPTEAACLTMADLEEAEHGDRGRVREWLTRAVSAPKDATWTADGVISDDWEPLSPVTGRLDAFEWKVPLEQLGGPTEEADYSLLASEPLVAETENVIDLEPVEDKPAAAVASVATGVVAAAAGSTISETSTADETPNVEEAAVSLEKPANPPEKEEQANEKVDETVVLVPDSTETDTASPYKNTDLDSDKDGVIDHRPDDPGVDENQPQKKKGLFF